MRASILQPPNVHLLSEDEVQTASPIHSNRNRSETGSFAYGRCASSDSVDNLIAGPSNHLLSGVITGGEQRVGLPNLVVTSENDAPSRVKGKRTWVDIAGSSGVRTNRVAEPSSKALNRTESYTIIARLVELGGCITRRQFQAAQRGYIKKPEDLFLLLDKDIRNLWEEIETLERQRQRVLSSVAFTATNVCSTAVEYFRLVRFGFPPRTGDLLGFVREAMATDVMFNAEYGPDAIVQYWCLANWFGDVNVEVHDVKTRADGSLVALTTTSVTITKQTLRNVFPHLHTTDTSDHNCTQAKHLLNQRFVMHGLTCFDWDSSTRRVTRLIAQSDTVTPMLLLVGNLEDASLIFEKALISSEFQWRQIMYYM